jgi:hypothetical protein
MLMVLRKLFRTRVDRVLWTGYGDAEKQSERWLLPQNHHWRESANGDGGDDDVFIRGLARGQAFESGSLLVACAAGARIELPRFGC